MAKGGSASSGAGSSGGRRSWRPSSANTRQARQEKVAGKWLLAVLAVALIALLIYVARGERLARTYVVTVTSGVPEALVVPPIALAAEDSAQLRDTPHAAAVEWDEQELGALARQWSQWKLEPQDAVLVYVNAHGVSDDGQAYLLQNDFMHWTDVGRAEAGRVPVAKLLDQFRDCPAGVRLLVLDCGRLASDPRLGMLVNEFPRLVAEQVKESSDANLWVLLANSTGETTLAQPSVGDSPFAAALADGLRGAASLPDKSGKVDRLVTLDELYRYLLLRLEDDLSSVVGARHTPLLLRGGAGLIQPGQVPTGIVLARIDAAKAAAAGASPAAAPPTGAPPADEKSSKTDKSASTVGRTPHRLGFARSLPAGLFHSLSVAQAGGDGSAAQKPQANPGSKENQSAGEKTPSDKTQSETSSSNKPQGEKPASDKPTSEKPPGDKAQGEKSTDVGADAGKDKGKDGGKESGKDSDAQSANKPTSEPAGEPTKRDERSAAQIALDAAWRVRDKLRDRANPEAWSPADFAPHLWRELDALLVDYEQRLRAGRAFHESELAAPLELLARELQTLDDALQQPTRAASAPSTESASVGVRMLAAWKRFQDDPRGRAAFRAGGRTLEEVRRALRLRADSLHAAADFVRWHDRASRRAASADALPLTSELVAWLRELNSQGRQLAAMEGQPIDASSAQQLTQLDDQIVRRRAALEKLLRDEARLIVDRAQAARRAPAPAPAKTSSTADELTAPIDDLLATALLPANDRQALAEVLKAMSSAAPPASESASSESASSASGNDDDGTKATAARKRPALAARDLDRRLAGLASRKVTLSPTARQWAVIAAQVDLELQLVGLVDPETAATLQPLVAEISDAAEQPSGAREEQLFAKLREAGRQFRDFYSQIPSTALRADSSAAGSRGAAGGAASGGASGATAANSPTGGVKSSWLLHLIDARDSREADRLLAERKSLPALRLLVRGPRLTPMLAVTPARGDVELDQGGWRPVTLPVAGVLQRPAASLVGNIKFNPQQVKVRLAGGSTELTSGAPFDIAVASNAEGQSTGSIALELLAMTTTGAADKLSLTVATSDNGQTAQAEIPFRLPKPNEVTLIARRVGAVRDEPSSGRDGVALRGFPNRSTRFELELINRSGVPHAVKVELVAVPAVRDARWAPGRLFDSQGNLRRGVLAAVFDAEDKLRRTARVVAATPADAPLNLPADEQKVKVKFAPAAPPTPPAGAPAATGAATAQPPSPATIDVSTGLLCVISEIGGKNQRWLKWLEVAPLDPASYIQAAASYDAAAQRIVLNFTPSGKRDDGEPDLPDDLMQKPLEIQWDSLDEQLSQARRNERGRFDGRNAKIVLTADAPTDNIRKPELRVHVDGYPRAFVFEVPLVADKPAVDRRRSRESIHLDSLRVLNDPKSTRVFVFPETPPVGEPIVERNEETKIERVKLPATAPATFLVPRTPLELTFHVDAPLDAFTLDRDDDAIELRFDAQESAPLTFFSDRQSFMRLKEAGPDGLVLESELHDYVVPLYPEGLTDGDFQLAARLRLAQSADGDSRPHAVRVVFDSRAPEIKYVRPTPDLVQPIPQGSVVRLQLDIADRSGIDNAEFQLLDSADKVPFSRKFAASWFAGPGPWNLNLELKDVPPGEYRWRLVATDKVGLASTFEPKRLVIAPPQPAAEKKASIQGYVFKGTLRPPRFTVRIDGLDIPPVMTNEKGEFRFNDVPKDGKFKVIARGTISGVMHEGMIEAAASETPRTMPIELKKAGN